MQQAGSTGPDPTAAIAHAFWSPVRNAAFEYIKVFNGLNLDIFHLFQPFKANYSAAFLSSPIAQKPGMNM